MRYDFIKLQEVLDSNPAGTVRVGTQVDWGYTSDTLDQFVINSQLVAGIPGSTWDTPGYQIDDGEFIPCFVADTK